MAAGTVRLSRAGSATGGAGRAGGPGGPRRPGAAVTDGVALGAGDGHAHLGARAAAAAAARSRASAGSSRPKPWISPGRSARPSSVASGTTSSAGRALARRPAGGRPAEGGSPGAGPPFRGRWTAGPRTASSGSSPSPSPGRGCRRGRRIVPGVVARVVVPVRRLSAGLVVVIDGISVVRGSLRSRGLAGALSDSSHGQAAVLALRLVGMSIAVLCSARVPARRLPRRRRCPRRRLAVRQAIRFAAATPLIRSR